MERVFPGCKTLNAGQELSFWLLDVQIKNLEIVNSDSAPGTGGVAEDRGGRSSPKIILYLNLSTSPARYARRPLLFQEGSRERLYFKVPHDQTQTETLPGYERRGE